MFGRGAIYVVQIIGKGARARNRSRNGSSSFSFRVFSVFRGPSYSKRTTEHTEDTEQEQVEEEGEKQKLTSALQGIQRESELFSLPLPKKVLMIKTCAPVL